MTVGKGVVHAEAVTVPVILSGCSRDLVEPVHVVAGPAVVVVARPHRGVCGRRGRLRGLDLLVVDGILKVAAFIVVAPFMGMALACSTRSWS